MFGDGGIGVADRKRAVHFAGDLPAFAAQTEQDGRRDRSSDAAAGVEDDFQRARERRHVAPEMLVIRRNDRVALALAAGIFLELLALHTLAQVLDLRAVERIFAHADFEAVVLGGVVARGDHHAAVDVEMKEREVEQRRRADADIVDAKAGGEESLDHSFGVRIGGRAAVAADGNAPRSEEHTSELQSHYFISYAVFCLK